LVAVLGEEHNAPEWYIYSDVAAALGTAGPAAKAAAPGLIPLLGAKYGAVIQAAAHDALKAITGEDYGTDIERWERWWVDHQ
jgi:hypothetical protein